jgi:hypothetical protein
VGAAAAPLVCASPSEHDTGLHFAAIIMQSARNSVLSNLAAFVVGCQIMRLLERCGKT